MIALNINYIEALWLAANAVALYFTALNYLESREQKEALHPLRNGRLIIVNGNLRRDKNRLLKIIAMLAVGIWASFLPGEVTNPAGAFLLLFIPYVLLFDSAADNRDRRRLVAAKKAEVIQEGGWDGTERRRGN